MHQQLQKCNMDPAMPLVSGKPRLTRKPAEAATEAEFNSWMVQLRLRRIEMEVDLSNPEDGTYKLCLPGGDEAHIDRQGNMLANNAYLDDAREEFYD